jgi:hypothetical protein
MRVTNISSDRVNFDPRDQKLFREPSRASGPVPPGGWPCAVCDGEGARQMVNPGDSVEVEVSFDISGEEPGIKRVELHDSWLSGGANVYPFR